MQSYSQICALQTRVSTNFHSHGYSLVTGQLNPICGSPTAWWTPRLIHPFSICGVVDDGGCLRVCVVASFPATFCDMGVSIAMGVHQKLMLYFTENPAKKMIWGYPHFRKPLYINVMNSLSALSAKSGKKNGIKSKPSFCIRTRHSSGGTRHSPKHSKIIADPHKYSHVTTIFCWLSHHSWWLNPHCWWLNPHVWTLESYFVMVASPFWDIFGACHHHVITMSSPCHHHVITMKYGPASAFLLHLPAAWLWQQHTQRPSPSLGRCGDMGCS